MTPTEKYLEEKDNLKNARKNRILQAAFELFADMGIDTIAMTDIAKRAEIGVASLYRYFETKDEIAIRATIWAWEQEKNIFSPIFNTEEYKSLSGISQVQRILECFIELYENQKNFLRYIYFFDSYAVRTKIEKKRLKDYETIIGYVQQLVQRAIDKGIEDGSINEKYKNQTSILYFSLMHTLFSTAQKLILSENILEMDSIVSGKQQLQQITELLINGLK